MKKKALGKGLKAFLPDDYGILKEEKFVEMDIEQLKPNPLQPRKRFDSESLEELANSIRETGVLQPVVVIPEENYYRIVLGERRWRAAQKIGLKKIPVLIRNMTNEQQLEASLVENLQREDLNPIEIAAAYNKMVRELKYTQQAISEKVGKDRASVANYIRLLKLPQEIQDMLEEKKLSMGHARALITLDEHDLQISLARQIVKKNLSVRDVEKLINRVKEKSKPVKSPIFDPNLLSLQEEFIKRLSTKVAISGDQNQGVIKVYYYSVDELNRIFEKIKE